MKTQSLIVLLASGSLFILPACDDNPPPPPKSTTTQKPPAAPQTPSKPTSDAPPIQRPQIEADANITAEVRHAVMGIAALSTAAQNCQITTDHGVVTLRGSVNSSAEKDQVESAAKTVPGVTRVDNQLEIHP